MKRTVDQKEHTEEFKRAVEDCKAKAKPGTNCFAVITKSFQDSGKPIFKPEKKSKQIMQGLTEMSVRIYGEIDG